MLSNGLSGRASAFGDALWLLGLMLYVVSGVVLVPFHGDESTLIMMSRDYHDLFIARDVDRLVYHDPPLAATAQHLRLLNGTMPPYVIGLGWHVAGFTVDDLNDQWLWGAGWQWNIDNGHMPGDGLLLAARWPNALLTAFSLPLLFALARLWGGRWLAYPATLFFALHPAILLHGRRAYMEAPLLFFGLLTVLTAAGWGRWLRQGRGQMWPGAAWTVSLGMAAGLAVASKHSGAVIAAAAYLAVLLVALTGQRRLWIPALVGLALSGLLALSIFLALNPAWWGDPLGRPLEVLALRSDLLAGQMSAFPVSVYADVGARLAGLLGHLSLTPTAYYEVPVWADYIAEPSAAYQASPWTGIQYGANILTGVLGLGVLALTGLGIGRLVRDLRQTRHTTALVVALWGGLMLIFVLATIPLDWGRYAMPLYPAQVVLAGAGAGWLLERLIAGRLTAPPPPAPDSAAVPHD